MSSGDPRNLVVMRKGSDNDGSSQLSLEAYQAIRFFDGIARDAQDQPLVSPELVVQPFFRTRDGGRENVLVRGVEPVALQVHRRRAHRRRAHVHAELAARRWSARACSGRYAGAAARQRAAVRPRHAGRWSASSTPDGSSFESEVWVDVRELANDAKRTFPYSGIRLRAADGAEHGGRSSGASTTTRATRSRRSRRPTTTPSRRSRRTRSTSWSIGIAVLAGIGAGFGAANTMYAAVQARTAEIGTLRALGFSRGAILWSFQVEAVALSVLGFAHRRRAARCCCRRLIGALVGGIAFGARTFTTNVITLRVAPGDLRRAR